MSNNNKPNPYLFPPNSGKLECCPVCDSEDTTRTQVVIFKADCHPSDRSRGRDHTQCLTLLASTARSERLATLVTLRLRRRLPQTR
jgi:hypothetical protein